jgi:membrane protein
VLAEAFKSGKVRPIQFFVLVRQIAQRVRDADVIQVAASMAFYTLFSLFPLILLLISIGSIFLKDQGSLGQVLRFVGEILPGAQGVVNENITNVVQQRGTVGLVGFVTLLWSASNVFTTLSAHINAAWSGSGKRNFFEKRLIGLGIISAMILALVGYILATILFQLMAWLRVPFLGAASLSGGEAGGWVWSLLSWMLVLGLLSGIYGWIPKTHVPWQAALISGAITTFILLGLSRILTGLLALIIQRYQLIYGSLSALVAFMFYIYLTNLVVLIGAHVSAAISGYYKEEVT